MRRLLRLVGVRDRRWIPDDAKRLEHDDLVRGRLPQRTPNATHNPDPPRDRTTTGPFPRGWGPEPWPTSAPSAAPISPTPWFRPSPTRPLCERVGWWRPAEVRTLGDDFVRTASSAWSSLSLRVW